MLRVATIALSPYVARNTWRPTVRQELCCAPSNIGAVCGVDGGDRATYFGCVEIVEERQDGAYRGSAGGAARFGAAPLSSASLEFRTDVDVLLVCAGDSQLGCSRNVALATGAKLMPQTRAATLRCSVPMTCTNTRER